MTAILERREATSRWAQFCNWITSTENRLYIGWFGVIMIPCLLTATSVFILLFVVWHSCMPQREGPLLNIFVQILWSIQVRKFQLRVLLLCLSRSSDYGNL
jgi:hypothetical protein